MVTKPHIALLPSPGMGHAIPLLELAKRLVVHHDFRVSFLVIATNEPSAAMDQLFRSLPPGLDVVYLPTVDVTTVITDDMRILTRICAIVEEGLKSLKSVLVEIGKPRALVIDLFCTQAFEVCEELAIPVYSFFTASVCLLTFSLYLPTLDKEVEGELVDLPEPISVPGCTPVRTEDLLDQVRDRKDDQYRWYLLHLSRLPMAAGVFLNSWEDMEPVSIKALTENPFFKQIPTPPVYPVGPLIKEEESLTESDYDCLTWLDKQPLDSVLFISLGSGGTLTAEQLTELAWGLELSQQRFIFVVRVPSNGDASAAFFNQGGDINDPKAYLPDGFLERTQERGLVIPSWAPQLAVLKHQATAGFLSHCGWNSTLEAVKSGVPIIAWPLYAEQRMNATILEEEVGVAVKPRVEAGNDVVGREEIERVIRLVMEGEEGKVMRRRIRQLKESGDKALDKMVISHESTKPRVALLPSPGLGHCIPLLELAKRLVVLHGFRVSFLAITTNEASAASDNLLRSPTLPPGLDVVYLPPVDVYSITTDDMTVVARLAVIVKESLSKSLKSVLMELGKPKALIIDLFCTQAFDVCRELSIPAYSFFTASVKLLTFSLYLPTLDREVEGEFVDLPEAVKVPGCTPLRTEDLLDQVRNRKIDEYKWYLFHLNRLPLADGIFLNSWEGLEPICIKAVREDPFYKQIPTPQVYPVGPLIKEEEPFVSVADTECLKWLDKQPRDSVLFVALGSGGTLTREQLTELAWGLELSQQKFIFVVRMPTDGSASAVFFNVGSDVNDPKAYLPEGFLERTKDRALIVLSWAPQVSVLKHPSTGGFLSHCGWNSTLETVCNGVPMIAWPLYAEQKMNATFLEEEVGVAIKPSVEPGKRVVAREEIERVVRLVMEGEQGKAMRGRARELKESAAKVLEIGGSSYDSLAGLAKEWRKA
ncbi:hypothetical protein Tsubulata_034155, partial [Turnera subulata]